MKALIALALMAAPASALPAYDEHKGVVIFTQAPCTEVIAAIDADAPDPEDLDMVLHGVGGYLKSLTEVLAVKSMAWGFILGFDAASGGLHSETETTLERLRLVCARTPERPAAEILTGFIRQSGGR